MNAQKKTNHVKKPYCKVCHDAGKSEKEYTNHFVRSEQGPKGKVVCPTLLSLDCRYCREKGHTVKFCLILKKDKEKEDNHKAVTEKKPVKKLLSNSFSVLNEESDNEQPVKVKIMPMPIVEEFPALSKNIKVLEMKPIGVSYAAQAAKAPPAPVVKVALEIPFLVRQTNSYKVKPLYKKQVFTKSWADFTDSDEDDDYEEQQQEEDW